MVIFWMRTSDVLRLLILSFLILSGQLFGQEKTKIISNGSSSTFSSGEISYLIESSKVNLDPNSLVSKKMRLLNGSVPNFGFITDNVWFRIKIKSHFLTKEKILVQLSNPNLDKVDLFIYNEEGKKISEQHYSDLLSVSEQDQQSRRKPTFTVQSEPGQTFILVIKANNGGEQFHFDIRISDEEQILEGEVKETYLLGIFFGLLFFTILLNSYMWVITKDRISVYYTLYLSSSFFLHSSLLGFARIYFWPESTFLANHANPLFASLSVLFLLHFSRIYLNIKELLPTTDRIFKLISFSLIISIILSLIPLESAYRFSVLMINGITLFLNLLILPVAIVALKKGYRPALLFLIAFSILVLSVFAFILKNFGVIPSNFFTDFGFQIGTGAEVILFSVGIILRFRDAQRNALFRLEEINQLKQKANEELEVKVVERTKEISVKQQEIETKNKEILSSITYAKRIQEATIPDIEFVRSLIPEIGILYKPKDIVSGDFYLVSKKRKENTDLIFIAAADCTGHGVPGAMMSVLCSNLLNRNIEESLSNDPAEILEKTNQALNKELSRHKSPLQDGMDISLVVINKKDRIINWSGANLPLWLYRSGKLTIFEPVRRPVGISPVETPFQTEQLILELNDRLVLFSDGIVDQFGGPKMKKLRKTGLQDWLDESLEFKPEDHVLHIDSKLTQWMGNEEQTDDVLLIVFDHSW
jgi:two-component system, sensor histidine kinase LadS